MTCKGILQQVFICLRSSPHFVQQLQQFLVVFSTKQVEVAMSSTLLTSTSSATSTSSGSCASTRTTTTKNNSNSVPNYSTGENNIDPGS
jgi:hypothetical protein